MITRKMYERMITAWRAGRTLRQLLDEAEARRPMRDFKPRPEAATIGFYRARPGRRQGR